MVIGIIFIIIGILIAAYPVLLSLIVATFFITVGIVLTGVGYRYRNKSGGSDNPFQNFFTKF